MPRALSDLVSDAQGDPSQQVSLDEGGAAMGDSPGIGRSVLISRASVLLGVSRRTVYYWIRAGRLRTVRTLGGSQRVLVADISRLSEAQQFGARG